MMKKKRSITTGQSVVAAALSIYVYDTYIRIIRYRAYTLSCI